MQFDYCSVTCLPYYSELYKTQPRLNVAKFTPIHDFLLSPSSCYSYDPSGADFLVLVRVPASSLLMLSLTQLSLSMMSSLQNLTTPLPPKRTRLLPPEKSVIE